MTSTRTRTESSPPAGRSGEWTRLCTAVESAGTGAGRTVLVEGHSGSGKSHLLRAIEHLGRTQQRTTIAIRCSTLASDRPCGPVIDGMTLASVIPAPEVTPDADRLAATLADLARSEPIIVTVDDLQDADLGTQQVLFALSRLAEALPIAVIISGTDWPAAARPLVESVDDRIVLRPLAEDEQAQLAARLLGEAPGPILSDLLCSTGGNPLLTVRLVEALRAEDRVQNGEVDGTDLPPSYCRVVERFIGDVGDDACALLRAAAVLGSAARIDQLAAMLDRSLSDLIAPVGDLERRGLLRSDGHDRLSFAQPVVRDAIHRSLNAAERLELTARAAQQLECDDDRRALELYARVDGAHVGDRDATTSAHVRTLVRAGRFREAEQVAGAAIPRADDEGADELRAHLTEIRFHRARWNELVADAERWMTNRPGTIESDRLEANLAAAHAGLGRSEAATDVARRVLDRQGPAGDPIARSLAYQVLASARPGTAGGQDAVDLAHQAVREATRLGTWEAFRRHPHTTYAMALADAGRPDEALVALDEGRALADRLTTAWDDSPYCATAAIITTRLGRWPDAQQHLDRGLEAVAASGAVVPGVDLHATRMVIALGQGDLDAATSALDAAVRLLGDRPARTVPGLCRSWGALLEARGDLAGARDRLMDVWDAKPASLWINAGPALIRVVQQTDGVASPVAAEVAITVAEQAAATGAAWIAAHAARCEALVAQDADRLRETADRFADLGGLPDELECLLDAVRFARSAEEGEALRQRAEERCASLGGARRIAATQPSVGPEPARPARRRAARPVSGWASLTVAEERVARLVAQGHSNAEAGAELFVSARTVESHLRRIFAKLEIRKRVELAVLVSQLDDQ